MLVYGGNTASRLEKDLYGAHVFGIMYVQSWLYDIEMKVWKMAPIQGSRNGPVLPVQFSGSALVHKKYSIVIHIGGNSIFYTLDLRNFTWQVISPRGDSSFAVHVQS